DRRLAEQPRRVQLLVHGQGHVRGLCRAGQQVLGQRRPVVGTVGLVADDRQRPGVTLVAQHVRRAQPGERGADDDDPAAREVPVARKAHEVSFRYQSAIWSADGNHTSGNCFMWAIAWATYLARYGCPERNGCRPTPSTRGRLAPSA